jgi:hypothetical protein
MTPFALAIRDEGFENPKLLNKSVSEDGTESQHTIQSHTADLPLLEKAHLKQSQMNGQDESSSSASSTPSPDRLTNAMLTPPRSNQKPIETEGGKAKTVPRGKPADNKRRRELKYGNSVEAKVARKKSPLQGK